MEKGNPSRRFARLACNTCRRQKRRCSRELPTCALCLKTRRICDYPVDQPQGYAEGETASIFSANSLFPPLFFLDSYEFAHRRSTVQVPRINLPAENEDIIDGNTARMYRLIEIFFSSAHNFLPIVSKKRLYEKVENYEHYAPDIILLLHSMEALIWMDESAAGAGRDSAYSRAKQLFYMVESRGVITIHTIQAGLLLGLYEVANAIYPAAFLTAGHCARIGQALGLHDRRNARQIYQPTMSWTEMEEIRRTWWGVIVLDRFVNLGLGDRPLACEDARPEDLLPMDEVAWEMGEQTVIPSLAVSADTTLPAPPFARTCQAAHLLSRVLANINPSRTSMTSAEKYMEAMQLHGVITAFKEVLENETTAGDPASFTAYSTAQGICYSALITLCDNYTCAERDDASAVGTPEQLQIQQVALQGLHEVCHSVWQFSNNIHAVIRAKGVGVISPLVAQCLYNASKQYWWYIQETGKVELMEVLRTLTTALQNVGEKWQAGGEYITILEAEGIPMST